MSIHTSPYGILTPVLSKSISINSFNRSPVICFNKYEYWTTFFIFLLFLNN